MKETCIFRVQFAGDLWRVMESKETTEAGWHKYRIMNNRRVFLKYTSTDGQFAIERCMVFALGCGVNIHWGSVL